MDMMQCNPTPILLEYITAFIMHVRCLVGVLGIILVLHILPFFLRGFRSGGIKTDPHLHFHSTDTLGGRPRVGETQSSMGGGSYYEYIRGRGGHVITY